MLRRPGHRPALLRVQATAMGVRPGFPRLGRARAEDLRREPGFVRPFPFTLFPTPHPQLEPARPAGWAGGGEVGGELCGAHRQWGRLAKPRDSPGKVAKCRLCCSPVRCPREPALESLRCDRRGCLPEPELACCFPSRPPSTASGFLPLAPPRKSHAHSAAFWDTLGEPGAGVARRKNTEPREEQRAKRTQWGSDTLRRPQARRPRPWKARSWTP